MDNYKKYRWFYTSKDNLVVGGKNAEQNDELVRKVLEMKKEYYVMHTSSPGSPFCVILTDLKKVTTGEIEEVAIFTGCFSRAWKEGKKKTRVDIFRVSQLSKEKGMKDGSWRVKGKIEHRDIELRLFLIKQKGILRAVPKTQKNKALGEICPGHQDKKTMAVQLEVSLGTGTNYDELMAALPAGGIKICL